MTADPEFPADRAAFFDDLDRQRPARAAASALGLAAGLAGLPAPAARGSPIELTCLSEGAAFVAPGTQGTLEPFGC